MNGMWLGYTAGILIAFAFLRAGTRLRWEWALALAIAWPLIALECVVNWWFG